MVRIHTPPDLYLFTKVLFSLSISAFPLNEIEERIILRVGPWSSRGTPGGLLGSPDYSSDPGFPGDSWDSSGPQVGVGGSGEATENYINDKVAGIFWMSSSPPPRGG